MSVSFTLISETPAKHAFALGRTGVAPPTPALGQSAGDRDNVAFSVSPPNATDGADIGVNLRLPTRVPTQAELITADGIAAGYYGQTAWGTYSGRSPGYLDLLARPGANALFNASFRLNWAGWSSGGLA